MLLPSVSSGRRLSRLFVFECRTFAIFWCARSYVQKLLLLCDEDRWLDSVSVSWEPLRSYIQTSLCACAGVSAHSAGRIQLNPISATVYLQLSWKPYAHIRKSCGGSRYTCNKKLCLLYLLPCSSTNCYDIEGENRDHRLRYREKRERERRNIYTR
jgi:hypothetical protein